MPSRQTVRKGIKTGFDRMVASGWLLAYEFQPGAGRDGHGVAPAWWKLTFRDKSQYMVRTSEAELLVAFHDATNSEGLLAP